MLQGTTIVASVVNDPDEIGAYMSSGLYTASASFSTSTGVRSVS
ncbi:hypothetical protein MA3A0122S_2462 [Mycobacteroides abscessus 3A-0122-S]|nr:hypothetical protein MA3A0122S_2462 [Mycobacteroides abscessus 3A-0122-S]